jgi:hypothetical protein
VCHVVPVSFVDARAIERKRRARLVAVTVSATDEPPWWLWEIGCILLLPVFGSPSTTICRTFHDTIFPKPSMVLVSSGSMSRTVSIRFVYCHTRLLSLPTRRGVVGLNRAKRPKAMPPGHQLPLEWKGGRCCYQTDTCPSR